MVVRKKEKYLSSCFTKDKLSEWVRWCVMHVVGLLISITFIILIIIIMQRRYKVILQACMWVRLSLSVTINYAVLATCSKAQHPWKIMNENKKGCQLTTLTWHFHVPSSRVSPTHTHIHTHTLMHSIYLSPSLSLFPPRVMCSLIKGVSAKNDPAKKILILCSNLFCFLPDSLYALFYTAALFP